MKSYAAAIGTASKLPLRFRQIRSLNIRLTFIPTITSFSKVTASWCKYRAPGFQSTTVTHRSLCKISIRQLTRITSTPPKESTARRMLHPVSCCRWQYIERGLTLTSVSLYVLRRGGVLSSDLFAILPLRRHESETESVKPHRCCADRVAH